MRVEITQSAFNDLAGVYDYYRERDYEHGERVVRAIINACEGLADFPLLGRVGKIAGTRERLMTRYPYRLVYTLDDAEGVIYVTRVVGQRQQWPPPGDSEGFEDGGT